jgi:hypothetical protein
MPILYKIFGKEKGIKIFEKLNYISFAIMMILNVLSIPILIYLAWIGQI